MVFVVRVMNSLQNLERQRAHPHHQVGGKQVHQPEAHESLPFAHVHLKCKHPHRVTSCCFDEQVRVRGRL